MLRYWDGTGWTNHYAPTPGPDPTSGRGIGALRYSAPSLWP